jgi:ubiquinone/menaquinone biosynthesis C-methylase UbiE
MATSLKKTKHQTSISRKKLADAKQNKQMAYAHFEASKTVNNRQVHTTLISAKNCAHEAIDLNPYDGDSFNLLARIELEIGDINDATTSINKAINLQNENGGYWYSYGHIALASQNLQLAETAFKKAIQYAPKETRADVHLAFTLYELGKTVEAFKHYRELAKTQGQDKHIRQGLLNCAALLSADYYDIELEQDLLVYLQWNNVNTDQLSKLTCSLIEHKFNITKDGSGSQFNEIASCPLFLSALKNTIIKSELLERLIIALRHELLNFASDKGQLSNEFIPLCLSISYYGWRNEFILPYTDAEKNMVSVLKDMISKALETPGCTPIDLSGALLLVAMYSYWDSIPNADRLMAFDDESWPTITYDLKILLDKRRMIANYNFEEITRIPSNEQHDVKAQYERFPYPQWENLDIKTPIEYGLALKHQYPNANLPNYIFSNNLNILVAGCGTGRHAINAACYFKNVNIIALDICKNSLAYAKFKADEFGVDNIDFKLADLAKLDHLDHKFDVIECSGVLHHIKHYKKSLNNLLSNLKPNGLIKISLYSERARKPVITIRDLFKRNETELNEHKIRIARQAIMQSESLENTKGVLNSDDFYSMSGTVDLLFHQFEKHFTPLSLKSLCKSHNLDWLGFSNLGRDTKQQFMKFHGSSYDFTDLNQWEEFEKVYPETFASMYQFYCQYKPKLRKC